MHHTGRVRSRVPDGILILIRGLDSAVYLVEHSKKQTVSKLPKDYFIPDFRIINMMMNMK